VQREYPDLPLVGVGAVIVRNGKVVLVKRGQPPLQGEWSIPGGRLELGETVRQAVCREVREETGLTVETSQLLGIFDRIVRDEDGRIRYHYLLIDFLCRVVSGELRAASDAQDARWFELEEISRFALRDDTFAVIRAGIECAPSDN
jgi:8-oxo-dGTP diphosphatase